MDNNLGEVKCELRNDTKCLDAVSNDFFDRALSKPALNFLGRSLWVGCWLSRFAGASLLVLTICSSILFSLTTWFTLSPLPACCLLGGGTEPPVPAAAALPLDGEQDCRLGLALGASSTVDERPLGIPGLPRETEEGLSEKDAFKLAGALREKQGISDGFNDFGIMIGELRADDAEVFDTVDAELLGVAGTGLFSIIGLGLMTVDDCLIGIELT